MVGVVYLSERKTIPPKTVTYVHKLQRFTCTFDPNAPPDQRWVWQVNFTQVYKFYGSAPSLEGAQKKARAQIEKLVKSSHRAEENE